MEVTEIMIDQRVGFKPSFFGRTVAYKPELVGPLGGVNQALLMSQFLWLNDNEADEDGWFSRSVSELEADTGLSWRQQKTAREKLELAGVIESKLIGSPPVVGVKINVDELLEIVAQYRAKREINIAQSAKSISRSPQALKSRKARYSHYRKTLKDKIKNSRTATPSEKLSEQSTQDKSAIIISEPVIQAQPKTKQKNKPEKSEAKEAHDNMVKKLLEVTKGCYGVAYEDLDLSMMTKREWAEYHTSAKRAIEVGRVPADFDGFLSWFSNEDFRGRRGEKPALSVIKQKWADYVSFRDNKGAKNESNSICYSQDELSDDARAKIDALTIR